MASGVKDYHRELKDALSDIDKQICDILHYIEFYELDEAESVRMVELLKECREQRRDVKDETVRVEYFQKVLGTAGNLTKVQDSLKQINKLESRIYHPRKLPELFMHCPEKTVRQNKLMRAFEEQTCMEVKNGNAEHQTVRQYTEEEGARVEYTKQPTIFDGRENDWLRFAMQQAEFYANAEQYICNLQTGLREIDEEIEQVLAKVENANYNCAQGYQVFKHLKELRLTRKAKQKELDCQWMADNMLVCVGEIAAVYEEKGKEREEAVEVGLAG